jgi:hypothetical protein
LIGDEQEDFTHWRKATDWLQLCKGNAVLWEANIPASAQIEVSGNKVFVVYKHKQYVMRRPIVVPNHFRKQMVIGKE